MSYSIVTGGNPIADYTEFYENDTLRKAVISNGWEAGEKITAGQKDLYLFDHLQSDHSTPGGSTSNVAAILIKANLARNEKLDVDYIGMVGDDANGKMLRDAYEADGVKLHPEAAIPGLKTARSVVINDVPDGKGDVNRVIVTDPGNAKDIQGDQLPEIQQRVDQLTRKNGKKGAVFVAGGMMEKMSDTKVKPWDFAERDALGVCDALVDGRFRNDKELWYALPTTAAHAKEVAERVEFDLSSANVILGNDVELKHVLGGDSRQETLERLRDHMKWKGLESKDRWSDDRNPSGHIYDGCTDQVALITCDKDGADIVTSTNIIHIDGKQLPEGPAYMLGAGDAAFSGFLFGWMHRDELGYAADPDTALKKCGEMAVALATATISVPQARYPDPVSVLKEVAPELFQPREKGYVAREEAELATGAGRW